MPGVAPLRVVIAEDQALLRAGLARLLADVTDFMTLAAGDVLMLGTAAGAPCVRAGHSVAIEIDGLGRLEHALIQGSESTHSHAMEPRA